MTIKNTITTVGTALINKLKEKEEFSSFFEDESSKNKLLNSEKKIEDVISFLITKSPDDKILGPEINSTNSLIKEYIIEPVNLFLIVSDTIEGKIEGKILKKYFENKDGYFKFHKVEIVNVNDLQSTDPKKFKNDGLKNLVRNLGKIIREYAGITHKNAQPNIIINATGGYKAEIAFATVIGQAYGIPVYYQFEDFSSIIQLLPLPIALDFDFWEQAFPILKDLKNGTMEEEEYKDYCIEFESKLDWLVDKLSENGKTIYALSPIGELFFEVCEYYHSLEKEEISIPVVPEDKKKYKQIEDPTARSVVGAQRFIDKVIKESKYIYSINSTYANKDLPVKTKFIFSKNEIYLQYSDGKRTAKFEVRTSARDEKDKQKLILLLNKQFCDM